MKRRLRVDKIFICISVIFIFTLICIYGYRLVYYYKLEHKVVEIPVEEDTSIYDILMDDIINKDEVDILDVKKPNLKYDETLDEYYFYGNKDNNYVYYSGRYFRIIGVDKNKNIKMITDEVQTSLAYGNLEGYEQSDVYSWLNGNDEFEGIFLNSLNNYENYLEKTRTCGDEVIEINEASCDLNLEENFVESLSVYEYVRAGANESFLNNNSYFWTRSTSSDEAYYVFAKGGVSLADEKHMYGIRAVITLKGNTIVTGSGTKEDPYSFENIEINKLGDVSVGQYLSYSGYTFRVIAKDEDKIKIAMNGYIKEEDEVIEREFSAVDNKFDIKKKGNIGYYLNNDFYDTLENNDYLKKGYFYHSRFETDDFSYKLTFDEKVEAYIGLYQIGELFINDFEEVFTLNGLDDNVDDTIYVVDLDNKIYGDNFESKYKIRPVLYLDSELNVVSGKGLSDSPYEIGR